MKRSILIICALVLAGSLVAPVPSWAWWHGHVFVPFWFPPPPVYYYPYPYPPYGYPYPPPPPPPPGWHPPAERQPEPESGESEPAPQASYGLIQLRGVPESAKIDLDGRFWLQGSQVGGRWLALPAGAHRLTVRVGDARPVERQIDVAAGKSQIVRIDART